jgi:pyruvate/2-oxoglutarate dehydrogenase complex dihydrolipoamide acyltransferase (E2) component
VPATGVAYRTERLNRAKRTEAKYLRSAHDVILPSVVTVACPTRGFRAAAARVLPGNNVLAIILFETARLLRKYPVFNAFHADGTVNYYDDVNIGFAIDADRGLKVPVLKQADTKPLAALAAEVRELAVAYLDDSLPVESLAGATFTVTDLSGEGVALFHPLVNQGQAAILGVGTEVIAPGTGAGLYYLSLAFDHQLTEGRAAARLLGDLAERLAHHEAAMLQGREPAAEPCCTRCQATFSELAAIGRHLVSTVRGDGSSRLVCTRCLEGW